MRLICVALLAATNFPALLGQSAPANQPFTPYYGGYGNAPYVQETALIKVLVLPDGSPFSLESTTRPLSEPEVIALTNYFFQTSAKGLMVSLTLPVRQYNAEASSRFPRSLPPPVLQSTRLLAKSLNWGNALKLEKESESNLDMDARSALLWFAFAHSEPNYLSLRVRQLSWLIQNRPDAEILRTEKGLLPPEASITDHDRIANLWLAAVAKPRPAMETVEAAAKYLQFSHSDQVASFLSPYAEAEEVQEWLGENYAYAIKGVTGITDKGDYVVGSSLPQTSFANDARLLLERSQQLPLLFSAARRFALIDQNLAKQNRLPSGAAEMCGKLRARVLELDPNFDYSCPTTNIADSVTKGSLQKQARPTYPAEAKALRIQGQVEFAAMIGKDGKIKDLKLTAGPLLLYSSAYDAVRQWQYRPYLLNGQPVEVHTEIEVNYELRP